MPLETLGAIDWKSLSHAYGPAGDVPRMLRALQSTSRSVRENAWSDLELTVLHQGSVWQATPPVVPFLLELLEEGPAPLEVLEFLGGLVELDAEGGFLVSPEPPGGEVSVEPGDGSCHRGAARRTREAVLLGLTDYQRLLRSEEAGFVMAAGRLLGLLGGEEALGLLSERYLAHPDALVRGALLWHLSRLARRLGRETPLLAQALAAPAPLVALTAAVAHLYLPAPPPRAAALVADGIAHPERYPRAEDLPFWGSPPELCRAVLGAPRELAPVLVPALLHATEAPWAEGVLGSDYLVGALMNLTFGPLDWEEVAARGRGWRRPASELDEIQRATLRALVRQPRLWKLGSAENGNMGAQLNPRGLPTALGELEAYVRALAPP